MAATQKWTCTNPFLNICIEDGTKGLYSTQQSCLNQCHLPSVIQNMTRNFLPIHERSYRSINRASYLKSARERKEEERLIDLIQNCQEGSDDDVFEMLKRGIGRNYTDVLKDIIMTSSLEKKCNMNPYRRIRDLDIASSESTTVPTLSNLYDAGEWLQILDMLRQRRNILGTSALMDKILSDKNTSLDIKMKMLSDLYRVLKDTPFAIPIFNIFGSIISSFDKNRSDGGKIILSLPRILNKNLDIDWEKLSKSQAQSFNFDNLQQLIYYILTYFSGLSVLEREEKWQSLFFTKYPYRFIMIFLSNSDVEKLKQKLETDTHWMESLIHEEKVDTTTLKENLNWLHAIKEELTVAPSVFSIFPNSENWNWLVNIE